MIRFRRPAPIHQAFSALLLLTPLLVASAASAQEACGEQSCPKGFTCEAQSGGCPAIECFAPPCEPCVPATEYVCSPGPCSVNDDCAEGMACADVEQTTCTGPTTQGSCQEGDCRPDTPADCSTTTIKQCLPRWALACSADADCGVGFTCQDQQECSCPGSMGTATPGSSGPTPGSADSGPDAAEPAPGAPAAPAECTCAPTGQKACVATQVACANEAQCPSGWSCRDNPEGSCWADSNGNTGCTPADPAKLCMPPFSDVLAGSGVGTTTNAEGSPLPTAPGKASAADASGSSADAGGCSVGRAHGGATRDGLAWLLALAAAVGLSRRARKALES